MTRIPSRCLTDTYAVQSLHVTVRYLKNHRLRIRRVVEEDSDEVVPIIDAESSLLKQYYGEYYVSEMVRHPNDQRRLIVSENNEGLATGAMFLNSNVNIDILDEKFELIPYNGLRKPHPDDQICIEHIEAASEIFCPIFTRKPCQKTEKFVKKIPSDQSLGFESVSSLSFGDRQVYKSTFTAIHDLSGATVISELPSLTEYFTNNYYPKMLASIFEDTLFDAPRKGIAQAAMDDEGFGTMEINLPTLPVYHGKANVFALEIFATQNDVSDRWSQNFLQAAFECFPDLDYCTILFPYSQPFLPFLEHFVRVPLRCYKDYPMTLYLTHRAAVLGRISCRLATSLDRDKLQDLLRGISKSEKILIDFDAALNKERLDLVCYVFQWNDTIVGMIILCTEVDTTYIRRRYHVEDYIAMKNIPQDAYAYILHFVLMPIFAIHLNSFFREIMRLTDIIVLYYRLTESLLSALTRTHPLAICLQSMVSVTPRQRINYKFYGYVETDEPETEMESFSLFLITPRLAGIVHSVIDSRIVVVGGSDCGIAFIENLVFGATQSYTRFASLTLISTNGLPFENQRDAIVERMIPFYGRFCRNYRRVIPTRVFVNIVYGTVQTIDRKQKFVTVMNQGNISYDYLILTCGLQYQRPRFYQDEINPQKKGDLLENEIPWNCITINDDTEAAECLEKIQLLTNNFQDPSQFLYIYPKVCPAGSGQTDITFRLTNLRENIILYGHNMDCYCALQGLLEFGVIGNWITLIHPPLPLCETHKTIFFNDCDVYMETMKSITGSGVKIWEGWELIDWHMKESTEPKMIERIVVQLKGRQKTINCDALVNFSEKTINLKIFVAICRAGLVFDGLLVIDPEFRTNDPSIFAAGTVTKYRRKFYAESWQHTHYNSIEVGERMATVLRLTIHNQQRNNSPPSDSLEKKKYLTLPIFRSPLVVACILPGGYRYFHACKAGKTIQRDIAIRFNFYGDVLMTGSCTSEIGYFRMRLNHYDFVETITCFNKKDFEVYHIMSLYGKHESMLNELKTRFRNSLISDLYAYFREPWAMAIFYDRFECLRVENRATLLSKTAITGQSLTEDCIEALIKAKWEKLSDSDRRSIESKYAGSVYHQELEESLLDFLQFSEEDLPVYCTPGKLRELYADIENSPLYNDL